MLVEFKTTDTSKKIDVYLEEKIAQLIKAKGPISFAKYMDLALYHPGLGYYCRPQWQTGGKGDFYTSGDLGGTFSYILAWYIFQTWNEQNQPKEFSIIECGPGMGKIAFNILTCIEHNWPDLFASLTYYLVEIADGPRKAQRMLLNPLIEKGTKIVWTPELKQTPKVEAGIVLANELLDALPFRRLRRVSRNSIKEVKVDWDQGQFVEVLSKPPLELSRQEDILPTLRVGQEIEICLTMQYWLREAAETIKQGRVLVVDYGYELKEFQKKPLHRGTMRCYYEHQVDDNPFVKVGLKDITADVNFTALKKWAKTKGLSCEWYGTQGQFIHGLLQENQKEVLQLLSNQINRHALALATLTMPGAMGDIFKVAVLKK